MSEGGDDSGREVQRLRRDVDHFTVESAETRRLAAMADRDVSDLRAAFRSQTGLLNALRATQAEHGKTLLEHGQALGGLTLQVGALDAKVTALAQVQAQHTGILNEILRRLPGPSGGAT
jgi:transposase